VSDEACGSERNIQQLFRKDLAKNSSFNWLSLCGNAKAFGLMWKRADRMSIHVLVCASCSDREVSIPGMVVAVHLDT
jgi:hypothetical protein